MAFEVNLAYISLAAVLLLVGLEYKGKEFYGVAEEQVLVHLLVLGRLLGDEGESRGEEVDIESLWVGSFADVPGEGFELLDELGEYGVLRSLQITSIDCSLEEVND